MGTGEGVVVAGRLRRYQREVPSTSMVSRWLVTAGAATAAWAMEQPGDGTGGADDGAVPVAAVVAALVAGAAVPDDEQPAHAATRTRRPTASAAVPWRPVASRPRPRPSPRSLPPATTVSPPGTGARGR